MCPLLYLEVMCDVLFPVSGVMCDVSLTVSEVMCDVSFTVSGGDM